MALISNILLFTGIEQNIVYINCIRFCFLGGIWILFAFLTLALLSKTLNRNKVLEFRL